MKYATLITLLLLGSSCGLPLGKKRDMVHKNSTRQYVTTDQTFTVHIAAFEAQAKIELNRPNYQVVDIPINFGDTEDPKYAGVCFTYPNGNREIIINKTTWEALPYVQKRVLIFHELGHCALNRSHDEETTVVDGRTIKKSIMHPVIPSEPDYNLYQTAYLKELFTYSTALFTSMGAKIID